MQVFFLVVLTTSLSVGAFSSRAKRSADPHLDAELSSLRSQLVADSQDNIAASPAVDVVDHARQPVTGFAKVAVEVSKAKDFGPAEQEREQLQNQLRESLAKQQHMAEQIHASEASAAWLSEELHNATARVSQLTREVAQEAQRDGDDESKVKGIEDDGNQQKDKVRKLQNHEKKLQKMTQKLLKADQDLQTRTNSLQKDARDLQATNKKLLAQNAVVAKEKAGLDAQVAETKASEKEFDDQLSKTDSMMEKLQKEFTRKVGELKKKAEEEKKKLDKIQESLGANLKAHEANLLNRTKKIEVLEEKANEALEREKSAEDKAKQSDETIRSMQAEKQRLLDEQASLTSKGQELNSLGADLREKLNTTIAVASKAATRKTKAEATTCKTVEKEFTEVLNRKRRAHKDLDMAVKLARKAQHENAALRQALAEVTEASKKLTARDSDASESMNRELRTLQNELQERQTTLTMMKERREKDSHGAPEQWDEKVEQDVPSSNLNLHAASAPIDDDASVGPDVEQEPEDDME